MKIEPRTQQRYTTAKHTGDIVLDAQGADPISQEVVPVIGGWIDYTGSGGVPTGQLMYAGGHADNLFGTNAYAKGAREKDMFNTGQIKQLNRKRRIKLYVKLD